MELSLASKRTTLKTAGKYCAEDIIVAASLQDKTVTPTASTQTISADANHVGLGTVTVNAVPTEEKTVTTNGEVTPSSGKFLSKVIVNVPSDEPVTEEKTITENGEYTPPIGIDGFSKVTVRVPGEYLSFVNASIGLSRTISGVAISDDAISFVSVSHEVTAAESN